ncbi:5'-nucleotidase domain-containing protein 1 [Sitodiplosis mosellana]|uniref:5'-nucleotidase domain-containing protein 1 n=1 Tax=Sitodiplosis mosellana TaxID=263140 RepID=UPI002444469C|nr:5'-nucleotidase domain-containing protein 1 [Sitodiplosis mosellana]
MLISKSVLLSQVQNKSCGQFSCQVRSLFLCVAATFEYTNNNKHNINFIRQYHSLRSNLANNNTARLATTPNASYANRNYSRFSANTILTGTAMMKLTDYDCIGFDLDNTLLRYKLTEMVELEYRVLSHFLIDVKGYPSKYLERPMVENIDFLQKGLIIDFARGNILKIAYDGYISKACHGTRQLTDDEIVDIYGKDRSWQVTSDFCKNLLEAWHGPLADDMRTLLDYFDMPASLVFARIVDTLDDANGNRPLPKYNIWPDILDGLGEIFTWEHFENDRSKYFASVKSDPGKYIHRSSDALKKWLTELRKHKTIFLLTGSHVDFASFTSSYAFGKDWRNYFDVIVCYAKKPGFFTKDRAFLRSHDTEETNEEIDPSKLKLGDVYTQGNWNGLMQCLAQKSKTTTPKVLYVGDNLIQDVYSPNEYSKADTIALAEEMMAEGMTGRASEHKDKRLLTSPLWGTYFLASNDEPTIWLEIIRKHAKLCVPNLDFIAAHPIDQEFKIFTQKMCTNGFYPNEPLCFTK